MCSDLDLTAGAKTDEAERHQARFEELQFLADWGMGATLINAALAASCFVGLMFMYQGVADAAKQTAAAVARVLLYNDAATAHNRASASYNDRLWFWQTHRMQPTTRLLSMPEAVEFVPPQVMTVARFRASFGFIWGSGLAFSI
jgi:hypothetical protein